jgi:predicted deacylase
LLTDVLADRPDLGVVMIHAFNPWGFAWLRRYDHEGIDLNRNFVDFAAPLPESPDYDRLHARLLAAGEVSADTLPRLYEDSDLAAFTAAVTGGQYRHRDGLFFGGRAPSWSRTVLEAITAAPLFAGARRIAVIDLHTGLGPYGYGEVINDHPVDSAGFRQAQTWYGDNACSTELGESVSSHKPGLLDYHWHDVIGERGCFVTLEFGTYDSRLLLAAAINEQQLHNRLTAAGTVRDTGHAGVQELARLFCPREASWQQQVLFRGRQVTGLALAGLLA